MSKARIVVIASIVVSVAVSACDDADAPEAAFRAVPSATATATPDLPFTLSQPLDAAAALTEERLDGRSWFIVDVDSGLVQVLEDSYVDPCPTVDPAGGNCVSHGGIIWVRWHDAETLAAIPMYGGGYLLGLDGASRGVASVVEPIGAPAVSPDGLWHASVLASGPGGALVSTADDRGPGEAAYRISAATLPVWSPRESSLLALLANVCSGPDQREGFDLALFEPNSGELRFIEELPGRLIPQYQWSPDGATIAADVVFTGDSASEPRREVELIEIPTAFLAHDAVFTRRTLLSISREGELISLEWNADGSKLIVGYNPGRGVCDPAAPPAAGTKVEVLPR